MKINVLPDTTYAVTGVLSLIITFTDEDVTLPVRQVQGSIDWGDNVTEDIGPFTLGVGETTTAPVEFSHSYSEGTYSINVAGSNSRYPIPDTSSYAYIFNNTTTVGEPAPAQGLKVGLILPRDVGFPNSEQWNFDIARDLVTVESAIKHLLLTTRGERIMDPEYGTNITSYVFEPDDSVTCAMIQQDVMSAIERYAPFVAVQSIVINRKNSRNTIQVEIQLISTPAKQSFQVNLAYER